MSLTQMSRLSVARLSTLSQHHILLSSSVSPLILSKRTIIQNPYRRPGEPREEKAPWENFKFNFAKGIEGIKENFKLIKKELKEGFEGKQLEHMSDQNSVIWEFRGPESLKKWTVSSDREIGGQSESYLKLGRNNTTCFFYGTLCSTPPRDGETKYSGYCTLRSKQHLGSFHRKKHFDWSSFNTLHLRVRGDGRPWMINLTSETYFSHQQDDIYCYFLYTRGGPFWQDVKIPFSKFFLTHRGRIQDHQHPMWLDKVNTIGLTLGDKADGPFQLEIDYIGVSKDYAHTEGFAYEVYERNPHV